MGPESVKKTGMLSRQELAAFFEDMGMMIRSGISVNEAVTLLLEETDSSDTVMHTALSCMSEKLYAGSPLAAAMRDAAAFPGYAADMVDSSEYTGNLESTLFHLSDYYRRENSIRNTLASAVRYPVILLIMITAVLIVMLAVVFPAFSGVYENLAGGIAASSFGWVSASFILCRVLLAVMLIILACLIAGAVSWKNGGRAGVRRALSHFSAFRELFEKMDLYRFTLCFDMFLSGGANRDEALEKSLPVAETEALRSKIGRCIEKTREGKSFSQTAYEENLYDRINNRMLLPAERSGMLDEVMEKITGNLANDIDERVSGIADTAEPLLTGVLMIAVGIMLVSLMVPLIGIMNSMG